MHSKLLIADDNRSIVEILRLNFELLGCTVVTAEDGEEAEKLLKSEKPDLVILDVMMPKQSGYQLCRKIKDSAETSKIPVILLTAKTLKEDVYWGYDCGADAYICKPYEPLQLEELVERLLNESKTGSRTTAWTGIPDASVVEKGYHERKSGGEDLILLEVSFSGRQVEIFRLKYGNAQFKDLIRVSSHLIVSAALSISPSSLVGQRPDDTFVVVVPRNELGNLQKRINDTVETAAINYYNEEDRKKGCVAYRDPLTMEQERIPFVVLTWAEI